MTAPWGWGQEAGNPQRRHIVAQTATAIGLAILRRPLLTTKIARKSSPNYKTVSYGQKIALADANLCPLVEACNVMQTETSKETGAIRSKVKTETYSWKCIFRFPDVTVCSLVGATSPGPFSQKFMAASLSLPYAYTQNLSGSAAEAEGSPLSCKRNP